MTNISKKANGADAQWANPASNAATAWDFGNGRKRLSGKSKDKLGYDQRIAKLELENEELQKDNEQLKKDVANLKYYDRQKGLELNKLRRRIFRA